MPAENTVYVGDIGTDIRVQVTENDAALDISAAATKQLKIRLLPSGDVVTKTASFVTTGTDGWLKYVVLSADVSGNLLNHAAGTWEVRPYLDLTSWSGHGTPDTFTVLPVVS